MEDMGSYFRKWREWRNSDLGSKSSTSIKGAEKDEEENNQSSNQLINNSNSMSIFSKFKLFNKLLTISTLYFLVLAKFVANFQQCYFIHS